MLKIAALIVTFNPDTKVLAKLVDRLKTSQLLLDIHLVDNASNNAKVLKDTYLPEHNYIFLSENLGLAGAQNILLQKIMNSDSDAVLFFDQDSEPTDDFITSLAQGLINLKSKGNKVGAVGPVFYDPRTGTKTPFSLIQGCRIRSIHPESNDPLKVSFLINSGMLVPVQTLKDVGLMRDELFIDYIDIEWCLRAAKDGYSFYAVPNAQMSHTIGDARKVFLGREVSIHSPLRRYYLARNSIYMMRLSYVPVGYKLREVFFSTIRTLMFVACVDKKLTYIKYIFRGWKDGIQRKYGKYAG
ncbi:glycosyltransferase family 2 protein [Enterobacter hormaechei]|uniref:glycosyltransferase family 2 protein n=1 Tax=Enterobacter hormaechei TaxID=158836 RepID=UPI001BD6968F|nr:glycosyltransferase family 2 protein [Enterobacter hormaechei]HBL4905335.1 glycosyltransferase family 2 protein [Enterobacter hormaechei]HBL5175380.1 glycosyltransferase family 2 protein [Enterobacter hormaechei]HBL6014414.1 glycosyltransferase family 2 protein [Enterobacter hormaechei]HBL6128895.1 glycosyltransferase family 2 protein [Enterobacter hormaechei]